MPSLGQIRVDGFEQDVTVNDRHQAFAAELLRLALLGVGGIGYVAARSLSAPGTSAGAFEIGHGAKWLILLAAIGFGISAASALALRYVSSELLALRLRVVRLQIRGDSDDGIVSKSEEARRNVRLKTSGPLLIIPSAFLTLSAGAFIAFLFLILSP
jgi:hypothetical protein